MGSGDPIVELRNSYRILFVERLSDVSNEAHQHGIYD